MRLLPGRRNHNSYHFLMPRLLPLALLALLLPALSSCLDVIDVEAPAAPALLAVEGQITDRAEGAVVRLSRTQTYFTTEAAPAVTGAVLTLTDDLGRSEALTEASPGRYVGNGAVPGRIGGHYVLRIAADGETYRAETDIRRTPPIDSLRLTYKEKQLGFDAGYYPLYYGPELAGVGDYYRFKVYKNGKLFNDPGDLIVRSDELVDGRYIGAVELTQDPVVRGDRVKVELNSIPRDYFYFLNEMFTQINNVGLFATSPANVRTNVKNTQAGSARSAVGYFAGFTVRADSVVVP